jgi:hypoxanthine-guanine phosphoribosyltransferase
MTRETLACAREKKIVLISHDLTQTGGPLLLIETAVKLREAGAHIELVSLADKTPRNNAAARNKIKVFPTRDSFELCAQADLVIANTTETRSWINRYLEKFPEVGIR